jgi:hypothetical protein
MRSRPTLPAEGPSRSHEHQAWEVERRHPQLVGTCSGEQFGGLGLLDVDAYPIGSTRRQTVAPESLVAPFVTAEERDVVRRQLAAQGIDSSHTWRPGEGFVR